MNLHPTPFRPAPVHPAHLYKMVAARTAFIRQAGHAVRRLPGGFAVVGVLGVEHAHVPAAPSRQRIYGSAGKMRPWNAGAGRWHDAMARCQVAKAAYKLEYVRNKGEVVQLLVRRMTGVPRPVKLATYALVSGWQVTDEIWHDMAPNTSLEDLNTRLAIN